MANQYQPNAGKATKEPKFLLGNLFVNAEVVVEPEEPQKIVVAGMAEARIKKEYPEGYFKRAIAVFQGEYANMIKTTVWFIASTLLFILVLTVAAKYFEDSVIGGTYNFMSAIGVGYPGIGDSISESVFRLYWDVYQPVIMMAAAAMIFASAFMSGQFYAAKRSFFQDLYKKSVATYWRGFAKYWWKFLLFGTIGTLVMLAMGTSLLNILAKLQIATAVAGDYVGVVFAFVFGAPILAYIMVLLSLATVYNLSFSGLLKDALVVIINNPLIVLIVGVLSAIPLLICIAGTVVAVIAYIAMAAAGFNFLALNWIAMAKRGMDKCKALKAHNDKKNMYIVRKASVNEYQGNPAKAKQKTKTEQKPYQNPKKKKKK